VVAAVAVFSSFHEDRGVSMRIAATAAILFAPLAVAQQVHVTFEQHPSNELENRYGVLADPTVTGYASNLATHLAQSARLHAPLKLKVLESTEPRAFVFTAGSLYITTGLLAQTETEAEFAGVLAHEIAHLAMPAFAACARWKSNTQPVPGSEDAEQAADTAAIEYLRATGYDPLGMLEFFNKLPYSEPRVLSPEYSHGLMMLHSYVEESVAGSRVCREHRRVRSNPPAFSAGTETGSSGKPPHFVKD
jgi:predicted Zn-dependent protease